MDNLEEAKRMFERQAYKALGIDVDKLPEAVVRRILKRLLSIAANSWDVRYIEACRKEIKKKAS